MKIFGRERKVHYVKGLVFGCYAALEAWKNKTDKKSKVTCKTCLKMQRKP